MNTNRLLAIVLVMQGAILLGQFTGHAVLPAATAQIPDAGSQREKMVDQLASLNAKMDKLLEKLDGQIQVQVVSSEEKK